MMNAEVCAVCGTLLSVSVGPEDRKKDKSEERPGPCEACKNFVTIRGVNADGKVTDLLHAPLDLMRAALLALGSQIKSPELKESFCAIVNRFEEGSEYHIATQVFRDMIKVLQHNGISMVRRKI